MRARVPNKKTGIRMLRQNRASILFYSKDKTIIASHLAASAEVTFAKYPETNNYP